jgi:hypothetical protein
MRATFETFSDSSTGPLSGFRSKGAMRHPDVYSLPATECLCCGSMEGLHADQYGETLCAECQERASGDTWFETGGG